MTFIPEVIKDIIYTYINELKTEEILSELQSKIKICRRCDEEKVVIENINDCRCQCGEFLCSDCYLYDDACIYCLDFDEALVSDDDYGWDRMYNNDFYDEDWQDIHGIRSYSQMY
ncbi:uncharacterized protein METZ01_LOCUS101459 [marine metagenome]|uniref:Uncharacterized protein n=1 Tax=marine metagenome TaxID=408172 RepID=A0A381W7Z7_9ZZZZ